MKSSRQTISQLKNESALVADTALRIKKVVDPLLAEMGREAARAVFNAYRGRIEGEWDRFLPIFFAASATGKIALEGALPELANSVLLDADNAFNNACLKEILDLEAERLRGGDQ